jgi:hypothetical protein
MTPEYILRKSLCRKPWCANKPGWEKTAQSHIENMEYAGEYAEPGYDNPKKGILFSDWNYFPAKVTDLLEQYGYSIEWEDEWTTCDGCRKALRSSPDSYSWQPSYIEDAEKGNRYCLDCVEEHAFKQYEDNPRRAVNLDIDLSKFGYIKIEPDKASYESGWHPGQNDDPKEIYARLKMEGHERILFQIDHQSQFYITFCVWKKEETDE